MSYRIASLLPSATEIVCAVGAESDLVGVSHECDFPESVRRLPALTRARLRAERGSRAIDRDWEKGILGVAVDTIVRTACPDEHPLRASDEAALLDCEDVAEAGWS
jgi:hypothetical protein